MISPQYGVKCLQLGFERYKRYSKLPIMIKVSQSSVSFYVQKPSMPKGKKARVSDHHPNLQNFTNNGDEPWYYFVVYRHDEIGWIELCHCTVVPTKPMDIYKFDVNVNYSIKVGSINSHGLV